MGDHYISRQISVYKTNKKLVEFIDKLKVAPKKYYAHVHAMGDKDPSGNKQISCIGVVLQDYTNGTGDQIVRVEANISPSEAEYIFTQVKNGISKFEFQQEKIFGLPDKDGRCRVTKLRIARATVGKDNKPRKFPWYIKVENGTVIKVQTDLGGAYIKENSYIQEKVVYLNINDLDFFNLMNGVSRFIRAWEVRVGSKAIAEGRQALAEAQAKK